MLLRRWLSFSTVAHSEADTSPSLPVSHNSQISTDVSFPESNPRVKHNSCLSIERHRWCDLSIYSDPRILASSPIILVSNARLLLGDSHRPFSSGNSGLGQLFTRKIWWEHSHVCPWVLKDRHMTLTPCPGSWQT